MNEVTKNLNKNGVTPEQVFNIASKNTIGKINKNEIKAAFSKLIPNFPRDLITDLFAELPA